MADSPLPQAGSSTRAGRAREHFAPLWLLLFTIAGCHADQPEPSAADADDGRLRVACTTGHVADMIARIGQHHVRVETLLGPGIDPHTYRATLRDTQMLGRADVIFYNGLHLEGRLAEVLENLARRKPVFAVTEDLVHRVPDRLRKPSAAADYYDPHVWFDAALWSECTIAAERRLCEADPAHADDYRRNAERYRAELGELDRWCRERIGKIPRQQRVLVTAHDAFGYFGAAYDIEVHGLQGISTVDEADLATVRALVRLLVERKIKAVFVESSVNPKNVQSLIENCAAAGHQVREGGELYSDALGPAETPAGNYIGMVRHNVELIAAALE